MPFPPGRQLTFLVALPLAFAAGALLRSMPPRARPTDAVATEFSAGRALETVRALAGDGSPRPVGTPADVRTVDAIVARLRASGLDVGVQDAFGCGIYGTCARVRNVVARLDAGPPGRKAVLLVTHHDSVGAGPGVADDLSGVATALEVVRAIAAGPPLRRPLMLLVTDGEESGLIGASVFLERHPSAADVGAVVNLDARGTTGPSIEFDASGAPAWIGRVLASLPRPVTSSVASAVSRLLPNDTDLAPFDRKGVPGVNLAFAFGAVRYHTPLDDLAHLDPAAVEHQGENALALVRAMAAENLEGGARGERAWFDALGLTVVSWPRPREVALAAALAALIVALAALRRDPRPLRSGAFGVASALLSLALAATAMVLLLLALRAGGALPRAFVAHPLPYQAAAWAAGAGGALLAPALLARRAGRRGMMAGAALLYAALAAALASALPVASHVAAVPAAAFALAAAARRFVPKGGRAALALDAFPATAASVVLSPLAFFLPPVMGAPAAAVSALLVAMILLPAAAGATPGLPHRFRPALAAFAAALALAGVQAALPQATRDAPERLTFIFQESPGEARWLAEAEHDALPPAVRAVAAFSERREVPVPWRPLRLAFVAPATPLDLAQPRLEVVASERMPGARRIRARLLSPRGAPVVVLLLPAAARIASVSVEGNLLPDPPPLALRLWGGYRLAGSMTTPAQGVSVEIVVEGDTSVEAIVVDQSLGLPAAGDALVLARRATAVPWWDGDVTVATSRAQL